jgi:hypothetical protein
MNRSTVNLIAVTERSERGYVDVHPGSVNDEIEMELAALGYAVSFSDRLWLGGFRIYSPESIQAGNYMLHVPPSIFTCAESQSAHVPDNNSLADEDSTEEGDEEAFDFWSDEGARRFNEALNEGIEYVLAHPHLAENFEESIDDEECEYVDPDLYDPDEETLTPGGIEIILENCNLNLFRGRPWP